MSKHSRYSNLESGWSLKKGMTIITLFCNLKNSCAICHASKIHTDTHIPIITLSYKCFYSIQFLSRFHPSISAFFQVLFVLLLHFLWEREKLFTDFKIICNLIIKNTSFEQLSNRIQSHINILVNLQCHSVFHD